MAWRISICVSAHPPRTAGALRHPARRARSTLSSASWRIAKAYSGLHSASNPVNNTRSEKAAGCYLRRVLSLSRRSVLVPPMCLVVIRGDVKLEVRPGVLSPAIRISYAMHFPMCSVQWSAAGEVEKCEAQEARRRRARTVRTCLLACHASQSSQRAMNA